MDEIEEREKLAMEIGRNFWRKKLQYRWEFSVLVAVGWYIRPGKLFRGNKR